MWLRHLIGQTPLSSVALVGNCINIYIKDANGNDSHRLAVCIYKKNFPTAKVQIAEPKMELPLCFRTWIELWGSSCPNKNLINKKLDTLEVCISQVVGEFFLQSMPWSEVSGNSGRENPKVVVIAVTKARTSRNEYIKGKSQARACKYRKLRSVITQRVLYRRKPWRQRKKKNKKRSLAIGTPNFPPRQKSLGAFFWKSWLSSQPILLPFLPCHHPI